MDEIYNQLWRCYCPAMMCPADRPVHQPLPILSPALFFAAPELQTIASLNIAQDYWCWELTTENFNPPALNCLFRCILEASIASSHGICLKSVPGWVIPWPWCSELFGLLMYGGSSLCLHCRHVWWMWRLGLRSVLSTRSVDESTSIMIAFC